MSEQPVEPTSAPAPSPTPPANTPAPEPDVSSVPAPVAGPFVPTTPTAGEVVDPTPDPAPSTAPSLPAGAVNATGDVMRPRTDDDVLTGAFARVVDGPEAGRYVVVQQTVTTNPDGYPETVQVKTRDDRDELLVVNYADLRPASPGGR